VYKPDSPLKQTIFEHIDGRQDQIVATLQDLVRFPTVNPPGDEQDHQDYVASRLKALGLDVKMIEAVSGRPNIVAILKGTGGGQNLLHYAGHADVVGAGDESAWQYPPFAGTVDNGWIFGRGAVDHKAPIAASLGALEAIVESGLQLAGDIVFMVPVDEERGSQAGTKYLLQQDVLYGDMGIYASAGFLEQVLISCSGTLSFEIKVVGRSSHSGYPKAGINAIEKASKLVLALQSMQFKKINPYWNPEDNDLLKPTRTGSLTVAQIQGGEAMNVVPGSCIVRASRRLIPNESVTEAKSEIEDLMASLSADDPDFEAEINYLTAVNGINTHPESDVVQIVQAAVRDIGLQPEVGGSSGGFDARWIVDALDIPFVSYGAGWNGPDGKLCLHAPNEAITIKNLMGMTRAFAMIMLRACEVAE
jgi:acetylornithine deacetylase/succinyl-diaminopimelate desuccinylase family protein